MSTTTAILIASALLSPVKDRAVFTERVKVTEESNAGKSYTRTVRFTYVDLNGDGKATALPPDNDLQDLAGFVKQEMPLAWPPFAARLKAIDQLMFIAPVQIAPGRFSVKLVDPNDPMDTFQRSWKRHGVTSLRRLDRAIVQAERAARSDRRDDSTRRRR